MSGPEPTPSAQERRALALYRAALGSAHLLMLGLSWPLWVGAGTFPRVPFTPGFPSPSGPPGWAVFAALLAAVAAAAAGWRWRGATWGAIGLLVFLVAGDQNRLQPWVYQYLLCGLAIATTPAPWGLRLARLFAIALYAHSGLSKLDATFAAELGRTFLETGL